MSNEIDDPMGMRYLFAEHPSDTSITSSSAAAATDTSAIEPPWAGVLQLSLRCLTQWLHPSNQGLVGLQAQHLDAILFLMAQGDSTPAAPAQAAKHSTDAGSGSSDLNIQDRLADSFRALRTVLLQLVQADEFSWACDHIVRSTLIRPKAALVFTTGSNGSSNMAGVICLAATCLMSGVQSCSARGEVCPLVMELWANLVGTVLSMGMTETEFIHQKASSRYDSNACAWRLGKLSTDIRLTETVLPHCPLPHCMALRYLCVSLE